MAAESVLANVHGTPLMDQDKVVFISMMAARACPFCSRHHFDISEAITFLRCECGAVFSAEWDEPNKTTLYTWIRGK